MSRLMQYQLGHRRVATGSGFQDEPVFVDTAHTTIIGAPESDKSRLIENSILETVEARDASGFSHGLTFITTKRDDVYELLEQLPAARLGDVVLFDPAAQHTGSPIGINIFHDVPKHRRYGVARLCAAIMEAVHYAMWGPQLFQYAYHSSYAMMAAPWQTMLGVYLMLIDYPYRKQRQALTAEAAEDIFWDKFVDEHQTKHTRSQNMNSTINKFELLMSDPLIRRVVGQAQQRLNFDTLIRTRRIFLVCLDDLEPAQRCFFASQIIALLDSHTQASGKAGQRCSDKRRQMVKRHRLVLKDFHNYVTPIVARLLSSGRNMPLATTISFDHLSQLTLQRGGRDYSLRDAILSASKHLIAFRLVPDDVQLLKKRFSQTRETEENLLDLPAHEALFGTDPKHERIEAVAIDRVRNPGHIEKAYAMTAHNYGRPAAEVEQDINEFLTAINAEDASGREQNKTQPGATRYVKRPASRIGLRSDKPLSPDEASKVISAQLAQTKRPHSKPPPKRSVKTPHKFSDIPLEGMP